MMGGSLTKKQKSWMNLEIKRDVKRVDNLIKNGYHFSHYPSYQVCSKWIYSNLSQINHICS